MEPKRRQKQKGCSHFQEWVADRLGLLSCSLSLTCSLWLSPAPICKPPNGKGHVGTSWGEASRQQPTQSEFASPTTHDKLSSPANSLPVKLNATHTDLVTKTSDETTTQMRPWPRWSHKCGLSGACGQRRPCAVSRFQTHTGTERINVYCCKPRTLGIICYTETDS